MAYNMTMKGSDIMKKYKFNMPLFALEYWATYFAVIIPIQFIFYEQINAKSTVQVTVTTTVFFIMGFAKFYYETVKRYIEFEDTVINFNSVRLSMTDVNVKYLTVTYDSILHITAKRTPGIGIYKVIITAKNTPAQIKVWGRYRKSKEMFEDFYRVCKEKNPKINFDGFSCDE